jgi:hypothetical protein
MRTHCLAALMLFGCSHDLGHGGQTSGGGGNGGGVTPAGLTFAVFGDARPANLNDTSGYPSTPLGGIFKLAEARGAEFVVGTGDYMFASNQATVDAQVQLFKQAASSFTRPIYLAMGNHECNGYTRSNCPSANETPNVRAFMGLLPSGTSKPYYRIDAETPKGKAKLLFVAANAWSAEQESWLANELADKTTYTFVVRHEEGSVTEAPGVAPSEALIAAAPLTLELLGHAHEYRRLDVQRVISGNGGAPSSSGEYGLLLIEQQSDGTFAVSELDHATGDVRDSWRITADGHAG